MGKKPYDEVGVAKDVSNNRGCYIQGKLITVDDTKTTVGNGTWGKIDYLCKQHGYSYVIGKVEKQFATKSKPKKGKDAKPYQTTNKMHDNNLIGKIDIKKVMRNTMKDLVIKN